MSSLVMGYSAFGAPSRGEGLGPFRALASKAVNLNKAKNIDEIDALVLWGGEDISPSLYNEKPIANSGPPKPSARDMFEWQLIKDAVEKNIPIIGICRGAQLACAYAGGKLIQHVSGHGTGWHDVETYDNLKLSTTSAHHQMLWIEGVEHELLAWSKWRNSSQYLPYDADYCRKMTNNLTIKEPEVVWFSQINCLAIQGHPEGHGEDDEFNNWCIEQFEFFCANQAKAC